MNKFTGKFEKLHEETLYRYQQGGFLRGDYVKIKKDALKNESIGQFSDQMKSILQDAIKNETTLRVSYIKSGRTESYSGPVDAANIPSCTLWADCYVEHAPGMWHNVMTIPLSILEKIEVEGANGFAPYDKNLVRPNTDEPDRMDKELKSQTLGDDENRKNAKKNTKLANTKEPKDGRKQTPFKEGVELGKENDCIFESYRKTITEGEYAQDIVDSGMMGVHPFGASNTRGRKKISSPEPAQGEIKARPKAQSNVSDDNFSWWYDEMMSSPGSEKMSGYEQAALAWHEAVKRMRSA